MKNETDKTILKRYLLALADKLFGRYFFEKVNLSIVVNKIIITDQYENKQNKKVNNLQDQDDNKNILKFESISRIHKFTPPNVNTPQSIKLNAAIYLFTINRCLFLIIILNAKMFNIMQFIKIIGKK